MQWGTFITSVGGAGAVLGIVGYLLKRSFESILNTKLKESEDRHKALMAETLRRQAALYDEQFEAFKTIVELVYRARNLAREIADSNGRVDRSTFSSLNNCHLSI